MARRDRRAGSRGEFSFKLGAREIGHLHGDRVAHFGFPKAVWQELYDAGPHRLSLGVPRQEGLGARDDPDEDDVRDVIALLRLNYDRVVGARAARVRAVWLREFGPPSVLVAR